MIYITNSYHKYTLIKKIIFFQLIWSICKFKMNDPVQFHLTDNTTKKEIPFTSSAEDTNIDAEEPTELTPEEQAEIDVSDQKA